VFVSRFLSSWTHCIAHSRYFVFVRAVRCWFLLSYKAEKTLFHFSAHPSLFWRCHQGVGLCSLLRFVFHVMFRALSTEFRVARCGVVHLVAILKTYIWLFFSSFAWCGILLLWTIFSLCFSRLLLVIFVLSFRSFRHFLLFSIVPWFFLWSLGGLPCFIFWSCLLRLSLVVADTSLSLSFFLSFFRIVYRIPTLHEAFLSPKINLCSGRVW